MLLALLGLGLAALSGAALWSQWSSARQARIDRLLVLTEVAAKVIDSNRGLATAIASAVAQQGSATAEIARNVQQTAASTQEVTTTITGVSQAANETGEAAGQVLDAAADLSQQAERLSSEVNRFVLGIRAA